jgi:hypothetical protein
VLKEKVRSDREETASPPGPAAFKASVGMAEQSLTGWDGLDERSRLEGITTAGANERTRQMESEGPCKRPGEL